MLQTHRFLEHQKSFLESESPRVLSGSHATPHAKLIKEERQLLGELFDDGRVLEDLARFFRETIDARWAYRVDDFPHAPVEQMLDDPGDFFESQTVFNAYLLEAVHRVEQVNSVAQKRCRVGRELYRLLGLLEDKSLVW